MKLTMADGSDTYTTPLDEDRVACFRPLPASGGRWCGRPAGQVECWVQPIGAAPLADAYNMAMPGAVAQRAARSLGRKMRDMV